MIGNAGLLESVIDHASQQGDIDYDEIASAVETLTGSGDHSLVPRLHEALHRFLEQENFYSRDLIAGVVAGVMGIAALPVPSGQGTRTAAYRLSLVMSRSWSISKPIRTCWNGTSMRTAVATSASHRSSPQRHVNDSAPLCSSKG